MRLGIVGYGRMGKSIEKQALSLGLEVVWIIKSELDWNEVDIHSNSADVVIEFTQPQAAVQNIKKLIECGLPVITGTTGWYEELDVLKKFVNENQGTLLYASNFSIGVNILFELNTFLAKFTAHFPAFSGKVTETHHIHKLDAPSGTATTLINGIIDQHPHYDNWHFINNEPKSNNSLPVDCKREGEVFGIHEVEWNSGDDRITISHEAHSRMGFTNGVLMAAQWVAGKKGIYTMRDVLLDLIKAAE
ncbi:MAG: 4-hydroxy-tetrahydrodipicolinate reductase [Saprospiraceae bacterium]|nr:4-hydroxy-tetrahydrodipicolinate reductase [Saprospiraceae bacterium]